MRLCACLGVGLDVIEPCGFALGERAVRRAAMDYAERVQVERHASWTAYLADRGGGRLLLLTTRGSVRHLDVHYRVDDVLLVGRESAGAPEEVHAAADARLIVPMQPGARSLNVVTAAALVLGEALRQTGGFAPLPIRHPSPLDVG